MGSIRQVKLEILRSGPAHNQLLSPLTPYYAICGSEGGITINFPFEQRHLLNRLSRLRYVTKTGAITSQQRESEIRELGEIIGRELGQIPTLVSELGRTGTSDEFVHLRLSMSAYELAMIPFELTIGACGFPSSGSPLFLQSHLPITITREVRHGEPLPVKWNRKPRILFAYANPVEFELVPFYDHLNALRRAIEPWVKWKPRPEDRLLEVKSILTVIPNASLEQIRLACLENEFSYVHILAHGAPFEEGGEQYFGLALIDDKDQNKTDIVSGERLSIALSAYNSKRYHARRPNLVSLSTCDSGNINTVLAPGGSIAHSLHEGGIPWVIASQFPLWMRASSLATETLFKGILNGEDPRCVLYKLRQRLRTDSDKTHDWASIVAYATVPSDFDFQISAFRDEQIRRKLNVKFDIADEYFKDLNNYALPEEYLDFEELFDSIRNVHEKWLKELPETAKPHERAEILGMRGAAEKRIGLLYDSDELKRIKAFKLSRNFYLRALNVDPMNFWVITQYLAMLAVLGKQDEKLTEKEEWWRACKQIAKWQLNNATGNDRAWGFGTLAELELLGIVFDRSGSPQKSDDLKCNINKYCQELVNCIGEDKFPIESTHRQFKRYTNKTYCKNPEMKELAKVALSVLKQD